ncbi:unnamed protein product [Dovyalis caffra]|uniref:RING-type domain-containing protein n=1 Tax=Dovyalis caffra TaxID=77055 RepID=A0AAV1RN21_9ROSI|nr:unnamed protein product [Dovyalis caffra]
MEGDESIMLCRDEILSSLSSIRSFMEEILSLNNMSLNRMPLMVETLQENTEILRESAETLRESTENLRKSIEAFKEAMMVILRKKAIVDDDHHDGSLCSICKEDMATGTIIVQLPCSHKFHKTCIMEWLKRKGTCQKWACPFCRFREVQIQNMEGDESRMLNRDEFLREYGKSDEEYRKSEEDYRGT